MTTTAVATIQTVLDKAGPNTIADALRKVALGTMLANSEYDTGTITASATITLPYEAAVVQSARVVTSGTAGSVGSYLVSDSGATTSLPTGASTQCGVATIGTDRKTITFPNTVTRVVVRYLPILTGLGTAFSDNSKA